MLPFLVSVPKDRRVVAAMVLAAVLVVLLVVVAIAQGIGNPSVPSGAVALVEDAPDGEITTEEFDRALKQAARAQQVAKVPEPVQPAVRGPSRRCDVRPAAGALVARRDLRARDHGLRQ